jgi:hypothetical protein
MEYTYPSEKWWSSSVGIIIPNLWKKMFHTTDQIIMVIITTNHGYEQYGAAQHNRGYPYFQKNRSWLWIYLNPWAVDSWGYITLVANYHFWGMTPLAYNPCYLFIASQPRFIHPGLALTSELGCWSWINFRYSNLRKLWKFETKPVESSLFHEC